MPEGEGAGFGVCSLWLWKKRCLLTSILILTLITGSSIHMKFDVVSVPTFMWPDYKVSRPQLEEIADIETVNAYDESPLFERMKNADGLLLLAHIPLTAKTVNRMT